MQEYARAILAEMALPESFLGFTMVALASEFWREQVESIPCSRRLLLLPHCLRNAAKCPASYDQQGLVCQACGACRLGEFKAAAESLGYQVLIAEGSPAVLDLILQGRADAILGVACLSSLEKALDRILLAGIPCMAIPLLEATCRDTSCDGDWLEAMIHTPYRPGGSSAKSYVHLLRFARRMFDEKELERLLPRTRGGLSLAQSNGQGLAGLDPVAATEAVAHAFLLEGGKHFRPFITLAAHDALTGGRGVGPTGAEHLAGLPEAVARIAMAIEVFHKASLVHDDIEDDDPYRYGRPTLHRAYGTPMAINVGDYLVGLGYRLVARQHAALGAEAVADILACLAEAHTRLSEGQGAELAWRAGPNKRLTPLETLRIYALKTAPAFEAALLAGLRLGGPIETYRPLAARYTRHLGVAFQILNDLNDWQGEPSNKRTQGTDVLGGRPTILWAMAMEGLSVPEQEQLEWLVSEPGPQAEILAGVRQYYDRLGVAAAAETLVVKHRERAHAVADEMEPVALSQFLHYLADAVLE